jgi:hypothetical protein
MLARLPRSRNALTGQSHHGHQRERSSGEAVPDSPGVGGVRRLPALAEHVSIRLNRSVSSGTSALVTPARMVSGPARPLQPGSRLPWPTSEMSQPSCGRTACRFRCAARRGSATPSWRCARHHRGRAPVEDPCGSGFHGDEPLDRCVHRGKRYRSDQGRVLAGYELASNPNRDTREGRIARRPGV